MKGVVNPALVRPKPEGGYEMVAGHRRKFASELAGKTDMPCIVRNLTDDEATIIMVGLCAPVRRLGWDTQTPRSYKILP